MFLDTFVFFNILKYIFYIVQYIILLKISKSQDYNDMNCCKKP